MTLLAKQALVEWEQRLAFARRMVSERRWSREEADARLFPWLAVALRAGAEPPEANAMLAEIRQEPDSPSEFTARAIAAGRLCPWPDMRAELTRARDAALAGALKKPGDRAVSERSTRLQFLALYLGCGMPAALDERIAA